MRLTDLDPHWFSEDGRHGQGLTFRCPACQNMRLGVAFENPVDGGPPEPPGKRGNEGRLWKRSAGTTFADMSITPSIDASQVKRREGESDKEYADRARPCTSGGQACWHGHITDGEVR